MNIVILKGRLGNDPELKHTPSGKAVCNFSLATSKNWINKSGEKQSATEWHRCVCWDKLGETMNQYLEKGKEVLVNGEIMTRSWEDKDGKKQYSTEINVKAFEFCGGKSDNESNNVGW